MTAEIPGHKILKTLGKGGMATVYLATQDIFERKVAIKVMSSALNEDPAFGQRFLREAQIVSQLIHPNIVTVYSAAMHENCYYLSMEYIDGDDLKHCRSQLPFFDKIQAIKDIASALDVSGAKGYVHRDIKPENIMIERQTKRAVLMDFGIARASEADIHVTQAGTAIGTPHYMSPEQAKGLDVDPRADLYSLGIVLFYSLTGYVPFEGDSAVTIGIKHITHAVPELPHDLRELQWLIDKSMAKDPDDRFQSGAEFIAAIDSIDLHEIAEVINDDGYGPNSAQLDAPTEKNGMPTHQYGDCSEVIDEEPESFTLNFQAINEPQTLNIQWPMYAAIVLVALLLVAGVYILATFTPSTTAPAPPTHDLAIQNTLSDLILGNKLSPEQKAEIKIIQSELTSLETKHGAIPTANELAALATVYQRLKTLSPNYPGLSAKLEMLAQQKAAIAITEFNQGNLERAANQLTAIKKLFPSYQSAQLQQAKILVANREQVEQLHNQGVHYFNRQRFTGTGTDNALSRYKTLLTIAPNYEPATRGISRIAQALTVRAKQAINNNTATDAATSTTANVNASALIDQALRALPSFKPAQAIEQQLINNGSSSDKMATLFLQAARHKDNNALYNPIGANAYDTLATILNLDKHNEKALAQQKQLPKQLLASADEYLKQQHYDKAKVQIQQALERFPQNTALQQAEQTLKQRIKDHQYQVTPRVMSIRASGVSKPAVNRAQPSKIVVQSKIYVAFNYENFQKGTTAIQVTLFDVTKNVALGDKLVYIKGPEGLENLIFDLPRNGLHRGDYRIVLNNNSTTLGSLTFTVSLR